VLPKVPGPNDLVSARVDEDSQIPTVRPVLPRFASTTAQPFVGVPRAFLLRHRLQRRRSVESAIAVRHYRNHRKVDEYGCAQSSSR